MRCSAQDLNTDMGFSIFFNKPVDDTSSPLFGGMANYSREKHLFHSFPDRTLTNYLDLNLRLPTQPISAWILERQTDDNFAPVFEITNFVSDPDYGCFIWQNFTLTTNQIHSLVASNWFVAVDFGDSNFVANMEPLYMFANGPTAKVVMPPVYEMRISPYYKAISLNNRDAQVVLDGSPSTDPYYLPIQFVWTAWNGIRTDAPLLFTNTEMRFTQNFEVGMYLVRLDVNDGIATGQSYPFTLDVRTAGQEVNSILSTIPNSVFTARQQDILSRALSTATAQFDQGRMKQGCDRLLLFKQLVKVFHVNSYASNYYFTYYSNRAQFVIDAFKRPTHRDVRTHQATPNLPLND